MNDREVTSRECYNLILDYCLRGAVIPITNDTALCADRPRRGVAQPGRAPGSGPGGRRFKSSLPDHSFQAVAAFSAEQFLGAIRATGNSGSTSMWKPRPVSSAACLLNSASALSDSTV